MQAARLFVRVGVVHFACLVGLECFEIHMVGRRSAYEDALKTGFQGRVHRKEHKPPVGVGIGLFPQSFHFGRRAYALDDGVPAGADRPIEQLIHDIRRPVFGPQAVGRFGHAVPVYGLPVFRYLLR